MKVFTFYYDRFETATTSEALHNNGIDHYVLIHKKEDKKKFIKNNKIFGTPVVTNNSTGLGYQRNAALDMMDDGEWAAFMCDDFIKIWSKSKDMILSNKNKLPVNNFNQSAYELGNNDEMSLKEMFSMFPALIKLAEKNNVYLVGFALHDNPFNLKNKFTTKGLADGRFWLIKKSNYRFDENVQLVDDVSWTAENIVRHGKVLVLNWCVPFFSRYSAGGFGSIEKRLEQRKKECAYLVKKFYPLVRFAKKAQWEAGTHIKLHVSSNNIKEVRKRYSI